MEERFAAPPADARILKIIHHFPKTPEAQDSLFRGLIGQGFGGMATNISFEQYLENEEDWASLVRGIPAAKVAGLSLWLYDEKGYPSGNAGGITMRDHPEWEARGRYFAEADSTGGPAQLPLPPGALVRAAVFPVVGGLVSMDGAVDLASAVKDGTLTWEAPSGAWHIMAMTEDRLYEGTHAAESLADKLPYINLLMPEPTARFLEVNHGGYAKHLGDNLGQYFVSTFTDEPSLMSLFLRKQSWRVLPWAPNLPIEFERRRGYALEPVLPALVAETGAKGLAVRYDFWKTVSELVSENYFGQIQSWCRQHQLASGGHLLMEEDMLTHVPLYGDFFRCLRKLDAPSMDCLTSLPEEVPWFVARMIGGIADLEGRPVTMCETSDFVQRYRPAGDTRPIREVSEAEIRGTINRLVLNGINTITSYYSFDKTPTDELLRLNEWTGRCCTMLRGGHQVADIALLCPTESAWIRFTPAHHFVHDAPPAAKRIEHIYRNAAEDLWNSGRDFTYIDSQALLDAKLENGVLKNGAMEWRAVILPCVDTLPIAAWEKLDRFVSSGGIVIAAGAWPANNAKEFPFPATGLFSKPLDDSNSPFTLRNEAGGAAIFLPRGWEGFLSLVLDKLLERDVRVDGAQSAIHATHREVNGRQIYFVINDSAEPWEGSVTFAAEGPGRQWDPATGKASSAAGSRAVALRLEPYGGRLFDFAECTIRPVLREMWFVSTQGRALPDAQPTLVQGEFVQGQLTPLSDCAANLKWLAKGIVTKNEVDTFLFAQFAYDTPLDCSGDVFLRFSIEIPPDQIATQPILVIVRDAKDVEYLAETEQFLNEPGTRDSYLLLKQFRRAGWSKEPAGTLDWSAIAAIRIGWGGHHGKESESIAFSFSAPQKGTLGP